MVNNELREATAVTASDDNFAGGAWIDANPGKCAPAPSHWFGGWMVRHGYDWQDICAQGAEIVVSPPSFVGRLKEQVALVKDAFLHRLGHSHEGLNGSHLRAV